MIKDTGKSVPVNGFAAKCGTLRDIPIVDAVFKWCNEHEDKMHCLLVKNALHVPSMMHNLMPPCIMQEVGVVVNDVPKIHVDDAGPEHHSIHFPEEEVQMPLKLNGVFSHFPTAKPTLEELEMVEEALCLTPVAECDPHTDICKMNEANMVDHEGNIVPERERVKILLSEVLEDSSATAKLKVSSMEMKAVADVFDQMDPTTVNHLTDTEAFSDHERLCAALLAGRDVAQFMATVGATTAINSQGLWDDEDTAETASMTDEDSCDTDTHMSEDDESDEQVPFDLNNKEEHEAHFASATHAEKPKGVSPETLSKVLKIDLETAKRTLKVTTQKMQQTGDTPPVQKPLNK